MPDFIRGQTTPTVRNTVSVACFLFQCNVTWPAARICWQLRSGQFCDHHVCYTIGSNGFILFKFFHQMKRSATSNFDVALLEGRCSQSAHFLDRGRPRANLRPPCQSSERSFLSGRQFDIPIKIAICLEGERRGPKFSWEAELEIWPVGFVLRDETWCWCVAEKADCWIGSILRLSNWLEYSTAFSSSFVYVV